MCARASVSTIAHVKIVVPVRLYPNAIQETALRVTLNLCNEAANIASAEAHRMRVTSKHSVQRLTYARLKGMGLSAQPAIHVARKVAGRTPHSKRRFGPALSASRDRSDVQR